MHLTRSIQTMSPLAGSVVCMGNFDGMHRGHQQLLMALKETAQHYNLPSVVILFEPHPREYFTPDACPARLMRLQDKLFYLKEFGIDQVVCLRFNAQLVALSAHSFITDYLVGQLHMRAIIVGQDCRFGHQRQGDVDLLKLLSLPGGYTVMVAEDECIAQQRVSSTAIRHALQSGQCAQAALLLGRPYSMSGRVAYGHQLGRTLGFPTANIACHRRQVPVLGVFAVQVTIQGLGGTYDGVAHIAKRHILNDTKPLLEVYLFDFDQVIYGRRVWVQFLHKIRDTIQVENLEALKLLISQDVKAAQDYLINK